jgi:hypothetical protein
MMRYLFCLFLCSIFYCSAAQDTLVRKMDIYGKAKPTSNLFVHFDKNVYANNETVWFTGYLLKTGKTEINQHHLMSVALVRESDSTIILEDKFFMENGLSFGSITLPDSIFTGNYHFLVYTDKLINGLPEAIFTQAVTLKTNIDPPFNANMKILEKVNGTGTNRILLSVTSKDYHFLPKPTKINYRYGNIFKSGKTDAVGQFMMNIEPISNLTDPNLYVKLVNEKDSTFLNMALPQTKSKALVNFYPEGGNMINGLSTTIAWEVKDQQRMPVALKALLFKNNHVIDTIETSSYGIGTFKIIPETNVAYTVKLVHSNLADSTYSLPKSLSNGLILNIQNAVIQDTLNIILHNFRETYLTIPFHMEILNRIIKIPIVDLPKGLATITILDSLQRPLAERMFFAHYETDKKILIATNQISYKQREKINLKLKLTTNKQALVSIACVQDNRLDLKKMTDIESYTFLSNELQNLPVNIKGNAYQDQTYLEQILLVKGWRRYTWQDLQSISVKDTLIKTDSLSITGQITKNKKELTSSMLLGAFGDDRMRMVTTATNGFYNYTDPELVFESGRKMYLFVSDKNKLPYQIETKDLYVLMNRKLAKSMVFENAILPSTLVNNDDLLIKGAEKAIRLREVKITGKPDGSLKFTAGLPGRNLCGDYVCMNRILNCKNHPNDPGNFQPVEGGSYLGGNGPYKGCKIMLKDENFVKVHAIHWPKEFYNNDYTDEREPAFFSTLYWNFTTSISSEKDTELSFYASDITGKFRIVIQGVSETSVLYAEHFFEVINKMPSDKR